MDSQTASILFFDVAEYSKLTEPQLRVYFDSIAPELAALFTKCKDKLIELNTWGDGIVAACGDPYILSRLALDIRDFFRNKNWQDYHLPNDLSCRIALNAGVVYVGKDPFRDKDGIVGSQVNLSAPNRAHHSSRRGMGH